jgi:tight adherence protein B
MAEFLVAFLVGVGLVLVYDGLTRPARHQRPSVLPGLLLAVVCGLLAGVAAWLVTGWPVVTLAAIAGGALLPGMLRARAQARRQAARSEALAEVAAGLRDAVRGGLGVTEALAGLARWAPPELRPQLATLAAQASVLGLPAALEAFARDLDDPLADLLAVTLALNARLGGRNLSEVLDDLAGAIRAEAHTLREIRARQAQQRLTARLVAAAPLAILLAIRQTNPAYLAPFDTVIGQLVLALALLLIAAGYSAMLAVGRPPAGARLLPSGGTR